MKFFLLDMLQEYKWYFLKIKNIEDIFFIITNLQQPAARLSQKEKEVEIIQEQILNKQFQESLDSFKQKC